MLPIIVGSSPFLFSLYGIIPCSLLSAKDARMLAPEVRQHLETKVAHLAKKLGITKHVELVEVPDLGGGATAQGCASLSGRAGILINPTLFAVLSEAEQESTLAHELVHIASNDLIYFGLLSGIVGLVSTAALKIFFLGASWMAPFIGLIVSSVAFILFSRYREERADKEGFALCSDAGRRAATAGFKLARQRIIEKRNDPNEALCVRFWRQIVFSKEGNNRFDLLHPKLTDRIAYLTELQRRDMASSLTSA